MSKNSFSTLSLPEEAKIVLEQFGENLRTARERRGESLHSWAARMDVSIPTLRRMEKGDPSVGFGIYATSIWLCGKLEELNHVVAPDMDREALENEILRAKRRRKT